MKFFKIGYNGGGGFLLEMGVWFYNGGWLTFKASLYCWQRGANPLILWRPPILHFLPFSNVVHPPKLPCHLQLSPPLSFLLPCFLSWMGDHTTFEVLFYLMIISIYTCQALVVPEGPWCVLYAIRHQVYLGLTHTI